MDFLCLAWMGLVLVVIMGWRFFERIIWDFEDWWDKQNRR